jgi:hypothetical protein
MSGMTTGASAWPDAETAISTAADRSSFFISVLINAQMSGFGDEADILCSTRALPVLTLSGPTDHCLFGKGQGRALRRTILAGANGRLYFLLAESSWNAVSSAD